MSTRPRPDDPLVSVVAPVLDEEECVDALAERVRESLAGAGLRHELIFVDDGSRDRTPDRIAKLRAFDPTVKTIRFTRSFGQQAALSAGLRFARGDVVVSLDGDLQHPPEIIPEMMEAWRGGADVVHTVRRDPAARTGGFKRATSRAFYALLSRISGSPVIADGADFRLLDRRAVDAFNQLQEHFVFLRGLVPWLGFPESRVQYAVEDRYAGRPKYRLRRMLRLALDGIVSFSVLPLRLIGLLGAATALFGVAFGVFALVSYAMGNVDGSGWTSLVVLILIFGGTQLLSLGMVAEYVGRTYEEAKGRPRYVIDRVEGIEWP